MWKKQYSFNAWSVFHSYTNFYTLAGFSETVPLGFNTISISIQGSYYVDLPDGRRQIVTYHVADEYSGYVADVRYEKQPNAYVEPVPAYGDSYGLQESQH